jgi:magnesium transporter
VIVDYALYRDGKRAEDVPRNMIRVAMEAKRDPNAFAWVGMFEPTPTDLLGLSRIFGFHKLAVEDACRAHQRPKVERYDDFAFVVLRTLSYDDAQSLVETGEIALFIGEHYIVSVRHGEAIPLHDVRKHLEEHSALLGHGPSAVLYGILDAVVDGYLDVAQELQVDIDELESDVFSPERSDDFERIYLLKRELQEMRRAVTPLMSAAARFVDGSASEIPEAARPFFRDVADHLARVGEQIDTMDTLLVSILQAHLGQVSLRQNQDTRKISAWAAILIVPTIVASIYGMNFEHMPELSWTFGYPFALVLMGGLVLGLYRVFKRAGWL